MDRLPADTRFGVYNYTIPRANIFKLCPDRARRKAAMETIFNELGASNYRSRRRVMEVVVEEISHHWSIMPQIVPTAELNKTLADAHRHAEGLFDALGRVPRWWWGGFFYEEGAGLSFEKFREYLVSVVAVTDAQSTVPRGRRPSSFSYRASAAVSRLGRFYLAAKNLRSAAGRRHGPYIETGEDGQPDGPFFRLVRAVFILAGERDGDDRDEAIFKAIRDYVRTRKEYVAKPPTEQPLAATSL